ncbi:MAG TPA: alpha/beta fold hydrolase [Mycobacteriales bacterium]|nr:alpha/beta fold hydrolase [Mycobacteriales bacterium]
MGVLPGAEPYEADGGRVGVLLSHGFTGTPQSLRAWAEHLAAAGYTVALPRLPGHGTRWQDLNATRWPDWYGEIERAFDRLRSRCEQVFAGGLSMGGTLVLRLAEQRAGEVAGLVVVNPHLGTERKDVKYLLPLLHRVVPSFPGIASDIRKPGVKELAYDRTPLRAMRSLTGLLKVVAADLPKITAPTLLYRSRIDHVVEPISGRLLREGASSIEVDERILEDSYHVATLDHDAPTIFAGSVEWIRRHTTPPAAGAGAPGADPAGTADAGRLPAGE